MRTAALKQVADIRVSNVDKKSVDGELPVRLCNYTDVYYRDEIRPELDLMSATATAEEIVRFRLQPGDIVITKDSETADDIGIPAYVAASADDLVCGYHLAILRPNPRILHQFLFWVMNSVVIRQQLETLATGVTRFGLRRDHIANTAVPMPDEPQQRAIADFLDAETARIDALITKKQSLLSLVAEHHDSLVASAVQGEGHPAGTTSSSHLYLQVPQGWVETELRHLGCRVQTGPFGSQLHAEDYIEDGWPVVNPMNLIGGAIVADQAMTVDERKRAELSRHMLTAGDIVFGRRGEMGRAGLVTEDQEGWLCGTGSLRLRIEGHGLLPEYLVELLRTSAARAYFGLASVGSTMDNLNSEIVLTFPCLVPPIPVQKQIVGAIAKSRETVRRVNGVLNRQIALLQERRQALITAAVTGELAVPGTA